MTNLKYLFFLALAVCLGRGAAQGGTPSKIMRGAYTRGKLDFHLMADSLHLNCFETRSGAGESSDEREAMLRNDAGLHVLNEPIPLSKFCQAVRMVYLVKSDPQDATLNRFTNRNKSAEVISGGTGIVLKAPGKAGALVSNTQPSNFYKPGTDYVATFRLKIEGNNDPGDEVVQCLIRGLRPEKDLASRTLQVRDFAREGEYYRFRLPFRAEGSSSTAPIDLRVLWQGKVTTCIDTVIVEDSRSDSLWSGAFDPAIKEVVGQYSRAHYPLTQAFYLFDEPNVNNFQAMHYVIDKIDEILGPANRIGCLTAEYHDYTRYFAEVQPSGIVHDPYFITPHIPAPSVQDKALSGSSGIQAWDPQVYVDSLQFAIDGAVSAHFHPVADAVKEAGFPTLVACPQMFGVCYSTTGSYDTHAQWDRRPPTASELRMEYGLAIVYGAVGFMPYIMNSDVPLRGGVSVTSIGVLSPPKPGRSLTYHAENLDTLYGKPVWTGVKERWDEFASLNSRLEQVGDVIMGMRWQSAKSWSKNSDQTADWVNLVSDVSASQDAGLKDGTPFVAVGSFLKDGVRYIAVLNRRCADNDSRTITLKLDSSSGHYVKATNVESGKSLEVAKDGSFSERFRPGDWQIYRLDEK